MISQLPKWVEVGAFYLALVAGFVNAIGLLSFEHQSLSHLSGTATLLGASLLHPSFTLLSQLVGVLLSFSLGAAVAGLLLHGSTLKLGRHYDTALLIESLLLMAALWLLTLDLFYGYFLAAAACGLQNALATTYSGAVIRTTHVTGIFTDLGLLLGAWVRGEVLDMRKAKLLLFIVAGFISGGTLGAFLFTQYHFLALIFPALSCLLMALAYRFYTKWRSLA